MNKLKNKWRKLWKIIKSLYADSSWPLLIVSSLGRIPFSWEIYASRETGGRYKSFFCTYCSSIAFSWKEPKCQSSIFWIPSPGLPTSYYSLNLYWSFILSSFHCVSLLESMQTPHRQGASECQPFSLLCPQFLKQCR